MPPHQDPPLCDTITLVEDNHNDVQLSTMTPSPIDNESSSSQIIRCAVLGCGMMGQEHCSYIMGYPNQLRIEYLCDPHLPSLEKCCHVMQEFSNTTSKPTSPTLLYHEEELLKHIHNIDLLVICTPNYLHTDSILRWGMYDHLTILVEKPVAVSREQHDILQKMTPTLKANIWVAMEYRFIPAITQLLSLRNTIGDIKMVTIRENRFPFLNKVHRWNRDRHKTGDSLVEKCCHFFDLMRLITGQEVNLSKIQSIAQRGLNYVDEPHPLTTTKTISDTYDGNSSSSSDDETPISVVDDNVNMDDFVPIIDAAYVTLPFQSSNNDKVRAIGCLELCMYADGSRHQEEIIVTGTKGRLEAYLPENKVYSYQRPTRDQWTNRSVPPPYDSIIRNVYDCSNVCAVHGIPSNTDSSTSNPIPTHGGYHYSSTAVEWYRLLEGIHQYRQTDVWKPLVSLQDGLHAVEIGLQATESIINDDE